MTILSQILGTREQGVPLGVVDKGMQFLSELRDVTFADVFGAIHTVYAHKEGPFQAVEDIIAAHHNGTLHPYPDHATAVEALRTRGDNATADKIAALTTDEKPAGKTKGDDL